MRYVTDNMLNGLARALPKAGIYCETALFAIRREVDSRKKLPDAEIFRFLLEKKFEMRPKHEAEGVTLITSDKDLAGYCEEFGLPCIYEEKPKTKSDFLQIAGRLARELL